jgi:hypothetical protein
VKFIILRHKVLYGYVTLFDVYECSINPDLLEERIEEGAQRFESVDYILVEMGRYMAHDHELASLGFEIDRRQNRMKAEFSDRLERYLNDHNIPFEIQIEQGIDSYPHPRDSTKREQFEAVRRWLYHDWKRIEPKLRTSIVEGISVFISLFDDNPAVKRTFCPPRECYDPEKNRDGRHGTPLPPFSELIETGAVCALNFPAADAEGDLPAGDASLVVGESQVPTIDRDTLAA